MKATIFDIQRFSVHDGPGIRTTIFFKGCLMNCLWCHNPESISAEIENFCADKKIGYEISIDELIKEVLKDRMFYEESKGGITLSGGEPMMQIVFLKTFLEEIKKYDIRVALDTAGYASYQDYDLIYKFVDLFLFDLKIADSSKHLEFTKVTNELILSNLFKLTERGNKVIIRLPLIPDITDTKENLVGVVNILKKFKNINEINLVKYNKIGEDKYERYKIENKLGRKETQTQFKLEEIKNLFKDINANIKYQ